MVCVCVSIVDVVILSAGKVISLDSSDTVVFSGPGPVYPGSCYCLWTGSYKVFKVTRCVCVCMCMRVRETKTENRDREKHSYDLRIPIS